MPSYKFPILAVAFLTACESAVHSADNSSVASPHRHSPHGYHASLAPAPYQASETLGLDLSALASLDDIVATSADRRVVFVGELHDRYEHHMNQLEIIKGLHRQNPKLAIGMEFFQQPFQEHLDAYVAGEIDEREMLLRTEYYDRWKYDFRLYAPILRYARDNAIPVIALNVPKELTEKVGRLGFDGLDEASRALLPQDIDRSNERYRSRIKEVYEQHPVRDGGDFDKFFEAQLLWDEGMAERAADYLSQNPDMRMVILAGQGHIAYRDGIPNRLARRIEATSAVVVHSAGQTPEAEMGDYLLLAKSASLPPAGKLGIYMAQDNGKVKLSAFSDDSAAREAGLEEGDVILSINGAQVGSQADVRAMMWDKKPGEAVSLAVARSQWLGADEKLSFDVTLR